MEEIPLNRLPIWELRRWSFAQSVRHANPPQSKAPARKPQRKADRDLALRKIKAESNELQNSILKELQPKASEALQEIMKEESIALLLTAEAVMIAAPGLDLTSKLTDRINKKTK